MWLIPLFAISSGCTRDRPTTPSDTDVDTDSDPPGPCVLDPRPSTGATVPVDGRGAYWMGGDSFCLSSVPLAEACDRYIPAYTNLGCPPIDWQGYENWTTATFNYDGKSWTDQQRQYEIDGDPIEQLVRYIDGRATVLVLDRFFADSQWGCDNGAGGAAVELIFGDAAYIHPCVAELSAP